MTRIKAIATGAAMTLVLGLPAGTLAQWDTHDRTIMTFSAAVELPGLRLAPGTYVFRLADMPTRNVIQVFTHDEMEILGQWLFIPVERREVTDETVVTFRETSAGSTPAVQYWFYPGESIGKEFIYPKDQALRIARRTGAPVLSEDGPVTAGAQPSAETPIAPAQEPGAVAARGEGVGVVEGGGLPATEPEPVGTEGRAAQATAEGARQEGRIQQEATAARGAGELPQTASPLALTGLLALLSLAGVAAYRSFRR